MANVQQRSHPVWMYFKSIEKVVQVFLIKVRCGWIFVAMYLRPLLYAKTIFKILEFYDKEFKRYPHFYMYYFPETSDFFSSLVQAVTSQTENCEHIKEVLIE